MVNSAFPNEKWLILWERVYGKILKMLFDLEYFWSLNPTNCFGVDLCIYWKTQICISAKYFNKDICKVSIGSIRLIFEEYIGVIKSNCQDILIRPHSHNNSCAWPVQLYSVSLNLPDWLARLTRLTECEYSNNKIGLMFWPTTLLLCLSHHIFS